MIFDPVLQIVFDTLKLIGQLLWGLDWILLHAGYLILYFNDLLVRNVFAPGLRMLGDQIAFGILPTVFTLAVIVLGITYVMAAFWVKNLNLVDWKKALAWLLGAILFYQAGPALFQDGETFRRELASLVYNIVLGIDPNTQTSAYLDPSQGSSASMLDDLRAVMYLGDPNPMGKLGNQFGPPYSNLDTSVDGLDVSMAYLMTTGPEVMGRGIDDLPDEIDNRFFRGRACWDVFGPFNIKVGTDCESWGGVFGREITGISRLFMGIPIIIFGIVEQLIYLLMSLAAATVFFTLALTLPLSFFTKTEGIASTLIKAYFRLFLTALFISMLQAVAVFIVIFGAMTGNAGIALSLTLVSFLLIIVAFRYATKAFLDLLGSMPGVAMVTGAVREYAGAYRQAQQANMMMAMMAGGGFRAAMGATAPGGYAGAGTTGGVSSPMMGVSSLLSPGSSPGRMGAGAGGGLAGFGGAGSTAPTPTGGIHLTAQEGINTSPGNTGSRVSPPQSQRSAIAAQDAVATTQLKKLEAQERRGTTGTMSGAASLTPPNLTSHPSEVSARGTPVTGAESASSRPESHHEPPSSPSPAWPTDLESTASLNLPAPESYDSDPGRSVGAPQPGGDQSEAASAPDQPSAAVGFAAHPDRFAQMTEAQRAEQGERLRAKRDVGFAAHPDRLAQMTEARRAELREEIRARTQAELRKKGESSSQ